MTVQHVFQRRHGAGWTARDADILFLCLFVRVMQHLVRHRARKQNQQIRISKILQSFFCLREDLRAAIVGLAQILVPPDHTFIPADNHYTHNLYSFVSFLCLHSYFLIRPLYFFYSDSLLSFDFKLAYANHCSKEKCLSAFTFVRSLRMGAAGVPPAAPKRRCFCLCFDLFRFVAGLRHRAMRAVTATRGFSFFLVSDKFADNDRYNQHQNQRYNDGAQILCDPI